MTEQMETEQHKLDIINKSRKVPKDEKQKFVAHKPEKVDDSPVVETTVATEVAPAPEPQAPSTETPGEPAVEQAKTLDPVDGIERKLADDGATELYKSVENGVERWLSLKEMHAEARLARASNEKFQKAAEAMKEAERIKAEYDVTKALLDNIPPVAPAPESQPDPFLEGEEPPAPVRDPRVDELLAEKEAELAAKAQSEKELALMKERQANIAGAFSEVEQFLTKTGVEMPADKGNAAQLITGMIESDCGGRTDEFYRRMASPNVILKKYHQVYSGGNSVETPIADPEPEPPVSSLASSAEVARNVEVEKLQGRIDNLTAFIDSPEANQKKRAKAVVERKTLKAQLKEIQNKGG